MPIGKIEPFDLTSKQWPAYIRRVKQFIVLNEIRDELQVPMLITVVGEATYALMCDLCAPDHPENKSFDTLTELVTNHLEPQRSEIAERHVFRQRRQRPDESLTEYLQHLKHLAVTCNFGTRLEEDLRDQFVSGLASDVMRSRIFAEKSLDYKKAVELALALEAAERHAGVSGGEMSASGGQAGEGLHAARSQRTRALRPGGGDAGAACYGAGASGNSHGSSPTPRIDELFTNLSNGEEYSKIDLRHAYEQVLLEESSQKYTAITTHIGTFIYRRTPYGLSCVPEKFQKLMEETLRGVPGTVVFLDDICVTGQNRQAHLNNLRAVLERLRQAGLTVKLNKCKFLQKNVNYLGFVIDKEGLHPDSEKLKAIHEIPTPKDVTQLKSFLGLINYYGRFIPNLSTILYPLHALLKRKNQWNWDLHCDTAFKSAKKALLGKRVLAHYEEGRPLVLSVDSSAYGIGAVLAHRYEDGQERPVSCASRTLNEAEKKYSQLDKEALAIYFGITKHHQFLFGRHFVLKTDHKPLTFIFGSNNGIPQTAASRLQRWAVRLAGYDFSIEFVRSKNNGPADALSRLPILHEQSRTHPAQQVTYTNLLEEMLPVNFKQIANESQKDSVLCKIIKYVMFGWPASVVSNEEKAYFIRKSEICVDLGCLMYKYRVIIPSGLRKTVLRELHEGHLGMNKMKNISRNYVYWPNIDNDIEELCRSCPACRHVRDAPAHAPLHPWEFPQHPWQRLHADFADCGGKRYLIIVDAHSKWIEVVEMLKTTASVTINSLRSVFARFGLPCQLVTDNGPPFLSEEFKTYCLKNCIKHTTSAPYRPQGNGEAENAVKTVKKIIKRAKYEREDISVALNRFLFQYRNCDHATTKVSPAVALLGHRLRSRLDALRPDVTSTVREEQDKQRARSTGCNKAFGIGEAVLVRDYTKRTGKWSEGLISEQTGPVSYKVKVGNGTEWRRHQDQLAPLKNNNNRYSLSRASQPEGENSTSGANVESDTETPSVGQPSQIKEAKEHSDHEDAQEASVSVESVPFPLPVVNPPVPGASARALRAYKRYNNLSNN
ncbi:uncharacterized protein K02A2.6-like [Pararge aegeria]|uniref:uncharacterized protein K02A2.6-like n=1 Tax=Pararge aegeria TaxID=116150 RepID=UPI0019D096FD|nr:uncharacterized protein K02A2.6-like [Pararge aegeria]